MPAGLRSAASSGEVDRLRTQVGGLESRHVAALGPGDLSQAEFQVFSQFGEDGIIQFLVQRVPIPNETFVEFGVGDYRESNTRFLLAHDNWRGLVMDSADGMHEFLRSTGLAWRHDIDAKTAFIDCANVNELIRAAGIEGDIGLLSIDLDGNDYWVLEAIDVVAPRIIVAEYNSVFGGEAAVTVPYDPSFVRGEKHWSWLYWGASLAALANLAGEKGYALVGGNRAGNNAFFVRRDLLGEMPEIDVLGAYRPSRFRESRSRTGELSYVARHEDRLRVIADMPLIDLESGREVTVAERFAIH
jgi:methyltransferase FkbM-like protein